jgi:hypothetical protein
MTGADLARHGRKFFSPARSVPSMLCTPIPRGARAPEQRLRETFRKIPLAAATPLELEYREFWKHH